MEIRVLLVHYPVVQRSIERTLRAELPDITVQRTDSPEQALHMMQDASFDAVLCGRTMWSDEPLWRNSQNFPLNSATPIIVITSGNETQSLDELRREEIQHFLVDPGPIELRDKLRELCDPSNHRVSPRLSIPGLKVWYRLPESLLLEASLLNLSNSGALLDMAPHPQLNPLLSHHIRMHFPQSYANLKVEDLVCRCVRVRPLEWSAEGVPMLYQIAIHFLSVPDDVLRDLNWALNKASVELHSW